MNDNNPKGMSVDIPDDAVAEALHSVEKHEKGPKPGQAKRAEVQREVAPEEPPGDEAEGPTREELLALVEKLRGDLASSKDRMLRIAADADNFRKRALKERQEFERFSQERLLRDLLPVLDNLERTLAHVPAEASDPALTTLRQGVELILHQFLEVLASYQLVTFSARGQQFDPNKHEALRRTETTDAAEGTVVEELQRGYLLHDRLLRPALVDVACAPSDKTERLPAEPPNEPDGRGNE